MNTKIKVGVAFLLVTLFLIPVSVAQERVNARDCELFINGGVGSITFIVKNNRDAEVSVNFAFSTFIGISGSGEFKVPAHGLASFTSPVVGIGIIHARLSAGRESIARTGFVIGIFVMFITPPYHSPYY